MSIEAMKQAIEALEHAEKDSADFQRINTDQTSAAIAVLRTAIQQAEAKTDETVAWDYELANSINPNNSYCNWSRYISRDKPQVPSKAIRNLRPLVFGDTHPAPCVPDDSKRLDYLQDRGATIDLIPGVADFYPMQFRVGGLHSSANTDVRAAIDAAMLTAAQAQKGQP